MTYKAMISKADLCEYKKDYKCAIHFLNLALDMHRQGSITKQSLRERINELQEKVDMINNMP